MNKTMTVNEQILFDTTDYYNYYERMKDEFESEEEVSFAFQEDLNYEREYTVECLDSFIERYEKRYRTKVCGILMIAERSQPVYGNWNGLDGRTGYRLITSPEELFQTNSDDIRIYIGEDGYINADYFDHDGANYSQLKLIPQSAEDNLYTSLAKEYGGVDLVGDLCEEDYAEYFQKKGGLKPTKFWAETKEN